MDIEKMVEIAAKYALDPRSNEEFYSASIALSLAVIARVMLDKRQEVLAERASHEVPR